MSSTTFQDAHVPVQLKLAAAWASFMFLYLYVDYLHLYKPGSLEEIMGGSVHDFETGPAFVALALALVGVPAMMVWLSVALPARADRAVNLVVAAVYVPASVYNATGEPWGYAGFYGLSIGLELVLLAFVLRTAWTWRPTSAPAAPATDRLVTPAAAPGGPR